MKKIQKEFQELLLTKTEGRMLEQLTVSSSCVLCRLELLYLRLFRFGSTFWGSQCQLLQVFQLSR